MDKYGSTMTSKSCGINVHNRKNDQEDNAECTRSIIFNWFNPTVDQDNRPAHPLQCAVI